MSTSVQHDNASRSDVDIDITRGSTAKTILAAAALSVAEVAGAILTSMLLAGCSNQNKSPWITPAQFAGGAPAVASYEQRASPYVDESKRYAYAILPAPRRGDYPEWARVRIQIMCAREHPGYCTYPSTPHCHGASPSTSYCHAHPGGEYAHDHFGDKEFFAVAGR